MSQLCIKPNLYTVFIHAHTHTHTHIHTHTHTHIHTHTHTCIYQVCAEAAPNFFTVRSFLLCIKPSFSISQLCIKTNLYTVFIGLRWSRTQLLHRTLIPQNRPHRSGPPPPHEYGTQREPGRIRQIRLPLRVPRDHRRHRRRRRRERGADILRAGGVCLFGLRGGAGPSRFRIVLQPQRQVRHIICYCIMCIKPSFYMSQLCIKPNYVSQPCIKPTYFYCLYTICIMYRAIKFAARSEDFVATLGIHLLNPFILCYYHLLNPIILCYIY
jgi:hypothetical protein